MQAWYLLHNACLGEVFFILNDETVCDGIDFFGGFATGGFGVRIFR